MAGVPSVYAGDEQGLHGAKEALDYLKALDFPPSTASFDADFDQG